MAGWKITNNNYATYSNVHKNSGAFTYGSNLCPCSAVCSPNLEYYAEAEIEQDNENFDPFPDGSSAIIKRISGKSCCNEGLTVWYGGSNENKYVICNTTTCFDAKNIDDCNHVAIGNIYGGEHVFSGSSTEHKIKYHTSADTLPNGCFEDLSVTEVYMPYYRYSGDGKTIKTIDDDCFKNCDNLSSITLSKVETIGKSAFSGCYRLSRIDWGNSGCNISSSVKTISDYAFDGCSGLTSVTIPNSVKSIGEGAFRYCSGLTSVTIPNSVTSIGGWIFAYCSSLTSMTIPNSVTSIGDDAFRGCSGLTSVNIPNSVTSIGDRAFSGCSELTSATIPNSVTSIGSEAFSKCRSLTSVVISNSVTSIGNSAFYGCSGLTSVTIPSSVTFIGSNAFDSCRGLTSVNIPNSVTSISKYSFENCTSVTSLTIGSGVTTIGDYAFNGMYSTASIKVLATTPPSLGSSVFSANSTIKVPSNSVNTYRQASGWSSYTITSI